MLREIKIRIDSADATGGRLHCQDCPARAAFAGSACPIGLPSAESAPAGPDAPAPDGCAGDRLDIKVLRRADYSLVRLTGEADLATACALHFRLTAALAQSPRLAVDVSGLEFIEMLGIRMLWRAADRAARQDGWVRLIGPRPQLQRLLELCGAGQVLPVFEDEDAVSVRVLPRA